MFIRVDVLKQLARKADPTKPFRIIIECDNKWTGEGREVKGPNTTYRLEQEDGK